MCSDEAADAHRFMDILDAAIKGKEVRLPGCLDARCTCRLW